MKDCVICLPLTIPSEIKIGLVLAPFAVSMLSRLTGTASVCCANLTGLRYEGIGADEATNRLEDFRKLLERMGIPIDHFWADSDTNHVDRLQGYCERLVATGALRYRRTQTLICQCGAVEILPEALRADWSRSHKVLRFEKGFASCMLCNTSLEAVQRSCLMLESRFMDGALFVLPPFYAKEIGELREKFQQPLLVSRQKKDGRRVSLFGQTWRLDTDFCWSLLFCSLLEDGFHPSAVVVSSRSLKPLVWSLGISRKLSGNLLDTTIIVTPFVQFRSGEPPSSGANILRKLIDRYGRLPIRLMMASWLKQDQKEVVASSGTLFWALKALSRESIAISADTDKIPLSFPEATRMMDGNLAEQFISDLRKGKCVQLSQYQRLLLERRD